MTQEISDPYSVVLKRKKLPMGLLQEAAEYSASKAAKAALLEQEPFEHAFGNAKRRKRVKLDQLLAPRVVDSKKKNDDDNNIINTNNDKCETVIQHESDTAGYEALLQTAQKSQETYDVVNSAEGIVPWGRDSNLIKSSGEGVDWRHQKKDDLFLKGQSKRIWGEFFKVVDCSDVILHIIDARNVPGTRCKMIERHIADHAKHKHLVFVLNKIDLVPNWVAKRWMGELAKDRPTIAFHASLTHAFGKGALISLLRQFGKLHEDKKQIAVGIIGYPNVGKSSVINCLVSKKSCKVAPIPGETKIWQYVTLFKRISLIDCPGVVVDTAGDTETDSVLKGVVRAERLEHPEDFIDAIMEKVKREHVAAQYKFGKGEDTWKDSTDLLEMIARKFGRLRKGGDPCLRSAAIMVINDFQRGRLPHFVPPPELKSDDNEHNDVGLPLQSNNDIHKVHISQDLDAIGEENMKDHQDTQEATSDNDKQENSTSDQGREEESSSSDSKDEEEKVSSSDHDVSAANLIGEGEWDD
jgi:nuclear GTP-binding protein